MPNEKAKKSQPSTKSKSDSHSQSRARKSTKPSVGESPKQLHTTTTLAKPSSRNKPKSEGLGSSKADTIKDSKQIPLSRAPSKNVSSKPLSKEVVPHKKAPGSDTRKTDKNAAQKNNSNPSLKSQKSKTSTQNSKEEKNVKTSKALPQKSEGSKRKEENKEKDKIRHTNEEKKKGYTQSSHKPSNSNESRKSDLKLGVRRKVKEPPNHSSSKSKTEMKIKKSSRTDEKSNEKSSNVNSNNEKNQNVQPIPPKIPEEINLKLGDSKKVKKSSHKDEKSEVKSLNEKIQNSQIIPNKIPELCIPNEKIDINLGDNKKIKEPSNHSSSKSSHEIKVKESLHKDEISEVRSSNENTQNVQLIPNKIPELCISSEKIDELQHQMKLETSLDEVVVPEEKKVIDLPLERIKKQAVIYNEPLHNIELSHHSLETLESGISMTSPHDLSDGEVEESISSRFVEVDEMDLNVEDPSPPSSNEYLHSSSSLFPFNSNTTNKEDLDEEKNDIDYEEDFEDYELDFDEDDEDSEMGEEDDESLTEDDDESLTEDDDESLTEDEEDLSEVDENEIVPDHQMEAVLKAMAEENERTKLLTPKHHSHMQENSLPETDSKPPNANPTLTSKLERPVTSRAYVNFAKAKEKNKNIKASQKMKSRGELLQEMIQLDSVYIDLYSQAPESYEAYIAAFGSANSTQVSVQTNEDALSEAVQTDTIQTLEKWTQKPIHIPTNGETLPTPQDYLGVGGETSSGDVDPYATPNGTSFDSNRLCKFLAGASQVVLMLLEEESLQNDQSSPNDPDNEKLGFCGSGVTLGTGLSSLLEGRLCHFVTFCLSDPLLLLTGHRNVDPDDHENIPPREGEETLESAMVSGSLVCLWSVRQPSFPQRILTCHSSPWVATFSPGHALVVLAGLSDGSLAAWDLRESSTRHPVSVMIDESRWRLSPPSFLTACSPEDVIEGSGIVALEAVRRDDDEDVANSGSFQVVSLSSAGQLTWWVLVQDKLRPVDVGGPGISSELGAAPWSRITLSRAFTTSVAHLLLQSEDLIGGPKVCHDLAFVTSDSSQTYVATATGAVINCSRHNIKMHPPFYTPELEPGAEALSISVCPHDSRYFLVGGGDGLIRLHCSTSPSPLTSWQSSINPTSVTKVQWSPSRPCVFYMLDSLGKFHIWDLSAGDILPVITIESGGLTEGNIVDFNIARPTPDAKETLFAAFASDTGSVILRSVASRFLRPSEEDYKDELERFECYVSII